jgi:hypothetical protein
MEVGVDEGRVGPLVFEGLEEFGIREDWLDSLARLELCGVGIEQPDLRFLANSWSQ